MKNQGNQTHMGRKSYAMQNLIIKKAGMAILILDKVHFREKKRNYGGQAGTYNDKRVNSPRRQQSCVCVHLTRGHKNT